MLNKHFLCCLILVSLISIYGFGQNWNNIVNEKPITGILESDLLMQFDCNYTGTLDSLQIAAIYDKQPSTGEKYSPLTAALYSAVIPGAGQFYTKTYWKTATFLGLEVAAWVLYAFYESKADKKTDEFEKFADAHWSVVRYARWIRDVCGYYYSGVISDTSVPDDVAQPWNYVNWDSLNMMENSVHEFSHNLAPYGTQQYYEMIGKYYQFGGGWDDAGYYKMSDLERGNVSPNFLKYSRMRGDANKLYNIAATVSYVIVANHLFSALEAAWNASRINKKLQIEGHILPRTIYRNIVEYVPTLKLKLTF